MTEEKSKLLEERGRLVQSRTGRVLDDRSFDEILSLRAGAHVSRWHTLPEIGRGQSVGEHSGNTVSLMLLLHPSPSLELIKAMLWHDTAERLVGDVPAPIRRANPVFAAEYEKAESGVTQSLHPTAHVALTGLDEEETYWLKAIDVLELLLHCHDQLMLGNRHYEAIADRAYGYLSSNEKTPLQVRQFASWCHEGDGRGRSHA